MHDAWLGFERVVVYLLKGKKMCHDTRKRRLSQGLCQTCGKVPHQPGRSNCRLCADIQLAKVKAHKAKKKAMLAENGGKPLRKVETNEQTARAIEQRAITIRAIRRMYWEHRWTVPEIAKQLRGRYSEKWIQDCVLYRFERVLV
jgi:hypothetical protein